jgi:hypothetical protein
LLFWSMAVAAVLLIGVSIIATILANPTLAAKADWVQPEMGPTEIQRLLGTTPIATTTGKHVTMTEWQDGACNFNILRRRDDLGNEHTISISCHIHQDAGLVWRLRRWLERSLRRPACPTDIWDRWLSGHDGWMEQWYDEKGNWLGERSWSFIAH